MMNGSIGLGFALSAVDNTGPAFKSASKRLNGLFDEGKGKAAGAKGAFTAGGASAGKGFVGGLKQTMGSGKDGGVAGAITKSFSGLFGKLAGFIGGGAIIGAFGKIIGTANEFTGSLAKLKAITNASDETMAKFRKTAMDAGIATQFKPTQAADALADLARKGYSASDSMTMLIPMLNLSAASLGKLDPAGAAGLASQTLKSFGLASDQTSVVVDKLVKGVPLLGLQFQDMSLAIGNASRGALLANQSLNETLIGVSLINRIVPGGARAGTAFSTALERLVNPKVQAALKGIGVAVVDTGGHIRQVTDIVNDMTAPLAKMTEANKAAFLSKTFGARAGGGMKDMLEGLSRGIKDASGNILKGSSAIAYLRDQLEHSKGSAAAFRDTLLKDLPGQLILLQGSISAAMVSLGQPMAAALAPIVKGFTDTANEIIQAFESLSDGAKQHIAEITLAVGGLAAVFAFAGGPVTLAIAAIGGAIVGLKYLIDENIGGLGDKFHNVMAKIGLAWDGLRQLITQSGFSGKVREELNKTENSGLKAFLVSVFVWGHRIKHFFEELGHGFKAGMEKAKPAFDAFGDALEKLAKALGLTSANDPAKNVSSWEKWGRIGEKVGLGIASAIEFVTEAITNVINYEAALVDAFQVLEPVWIDLRAAGSDLSDALRQIGEAMGLIDPSSSSTDWAQFGHIVGTVATFALKFMATEVRLVASALDDAATTINGIIQIVKGTFIGMVTGDWTTAWVGMKKVVHVVVKDIMKMIGDMVLGMAKAVDAMGKFAHEDLGAEKSVTGMLDRLNGKLGVEDEKKKGEAEPSQPQPMFHREGKPKMFVRQPSVLETSGVLAGAQGGIAGILLGQMNQRRNIVGDSERHLTRESAGHGGGKPIHLQSTTNLVLDGQVLARVVKQQIAEDKHRNGER